MNNATAPIVAKKTCRYTLFLGAPVAKHPEIIPSLLAIGWGVRGSASTATSNPATASARVFFSRAADRDRARVLALRLAAERGLPVSDVI